MIVPVNVTPAQLQDGLGVDLSTLLERVKTILEKGDQYTDIAINVLEDPALPQVVGLVRQLRVTEVAKAAVAPSSAPPAPAPKPVGIGLSKVVMPLKMYVDYRKNPVPYYLAAAGIVLSVVAVGFVAGRITKRTQKCQA